MTAHVEMRRGTYYDSVTLMQTSQRVVELPGVRAAMVAMATPLNLEVYERLGFDTAAIEAATPNDLLIAVDADADVLAAAVSALDSQLASPSGSGGGGTGEAVRPKTLGSALGDRRGSLALISVAGQYAFVEAMDALHAGVSVMVFSDNVPVEQEVRLKEEASRRGLLVMGPDCGTAVVGGVGLGFADALQPGPVGIVAASGTGAQQVSCLLDAAGVGVTAVLGVGGRDLSAAVGGRSTLAAMALLDQHPGTSLMIVISKPPDEAVAGQVLDAAESMTTPTLVGFVGRGREDMTALTATALALLGHGGQTPREWPAATPREARPGFIRGLFSGGTLCDEAMAIAAETLGPIASNTPLEPGWELPPDLHAAAHLMIDFGDDKLTQGRPHPMIDQSLRVARIAEEAADPGCAVLLLDVVLGYGANADPAAELAPAIAAARARAADDGRDLAVVVSLIGSAADPQGLDRTATALAAAGASVHLSNAAAARVATALVEGS
ncbi:MAG: FdrA family protein [Actinomycetes bacterium]